MISKTIECTARINAQDPDYPTYKAIACTAHINANDDGFYGALIDCTGSITNLIVSACRNWDQNIRLVITVNDVDVSEALTGNLTINHQKNRASTFNFALNNPDYSPRINSNIDLDKVVIITAYINGQEKKIFTGSADIPEASHEPAFRVIVTGRDYGKKLIDKKTTVISVQDLADSTKRNDLIKYLSELAGVTDVDIPEMDAVTIDNSFQDQSIWDMIQKEAMVELYWLKVNEEGQLQFRLDEIKSDTDLYPDPDWTYNESRIFRISYRKEKPEFNKITVLGKTTQRRIPNTTSYLTNPDYSTSPGGSVIFTPTIGTLFSDYISIPEGADLNGITYTKSVNNIILKLSGYYGHIGGMRFYIGCRGQYDWQDYIITAKDVTVTGADLKDDNPSNNYAFGSPISLHGTMFEVDADVIGGVIQAFTFAIDIKGYKNKPQGVIENIEDVYQPIYETDTTYETRYDQISAVVSDPNSIIKYGEIDYGTVEYPLLETKQHCIDVGSKAIRDAHRKIAQVDFRIPFNPLVETGQTILVTNQKIQLNERYFVENIQHTIDIANGRVTPRTTVGGVLYV